jgi:hypothetical protein
MFEKKSHTNEFTVLLTMRQLSLVVAALLGLSFFIFISGYFLGKKKAAEEFSYRTDQESLADQIYSSMCVLYDAKDENDEEEDSQEENETTEPNKQIDQKEEVAQESTAVVASAQKKYKLTLAGFSAAQHDEATAMVARLSKKGFSAQVNEIPSKTSKGKIITWYQVVANVTVPEGELELTQHEISKIAHVNKKSIRIDERA